MQFDSLAAALAMDGHGPYVWAVVVVTLLLVVGLLVVPSLASRRFLREQRSRFVQGQVDTEAVAPAAIIEEVNNAPGA